MLVKNIEAVELKNKEIRHKFKQKINLRDLLKKDIDKSIKKSINYEEFIKVLSINYVIKDKGKYLSFKNKYYGKSFIRCSNKLGQNYTREKIKEQILMNANKKKKNTISKEYKQIQNEIGFIIDTQANDLARTKIFYRNWAKKNNMNTVSELYSILKREFNITYNHLENIKKLEKENVKKIKTLKNVDDIKKLRLENYKLKKIRENIQKYNERENIVL